MIYKFRIFLINMAIISAQSRIALARDDLSRLLEKKRKAVHGYEMQKAIARKATVADKLSYAFARTEVMADYALKKNKPVNKLVPWVDYSPIDLDERCRHIMNGGTYPHYTGD